MQTESESILLNEIISGKRKLTLLWSLFTQPDKYTSFRHLLWVFLTLIFQSKDIIWRSKIKVSQLYQLDYFYLESYLVLTISQLFIVSRHKNLILKKEFHIHLFGEEICVSMQQLIAHFWDQMPVLLPSYVRRASRAFNLRQEQYTCLDVTPLLLHKASVT